MSVGVVQSEIVKRALAILHEGVNVQDSEEDAKVEHPEAATAETMAAQVLAEYEPSESELIVRAWHDILGVNYLKPEMVRLHLEALRRWQSRWHHNG